ncbi:hypothetical protein [Sutterella sp.]|nr:hypothetical protein [Sutterella sp.]
MRPPNSFAPSKSSVGPSPKSALSPFETWYFCEAKSPKKYST